MFKKIKAYFEKKKQKEKDYWDKLDLDREEKIWKIKKSKYDCRLKDSKGFFFYSLAVISIFLTLPIYFYIYSRIDFDKVDSRTNAYAEEINISNVAYEDVVNDSTAIVNFNQYIQNDKINGTYTAGQYYSNTLPVGQYYINIDSSDTADILLVYSGGGYYRIQVRNGGYSNIFNINQQISAIQLDNNITYTNFNAINLSQMFGEDNIPNLEQAQELFVADYYAYNTGSPMFLNQVDSYVAGYNDAVASTDLVVSPANFYANSYAVQGSINKGQSRFSSTVYRVQFDNLIAYNLGLTVVAGSGVTIDVGLLEAYLSTANYNVPDVTFYFGYYDNGSFVSLVQDTLSTSMGTVSGSYANGEYGSSVGEKMNAKWNTTYSFTAPVDFNTLYIKLYSPNSNVECGLNDVKIKYVVTNFEASLKDSYNAGYYAGSNRYQVGNNGYNQIFEAGRLQGVEDAGNYTFLSLLTSAIDVPINSVLHMLDFDLLGMNMKSFYLSMFTFAIIVFVIKLLI